MRRNDRAVMDTNGIIDILNECKVCHLGMSDNGMPYVVPLNYGFQMSDGCLTLYFHSAKSGRKLDVLQQNRRVCFEISAMGSLYFDEQNHCRSGCSFISIIGNGEASIVSDVNEKAQALSLLMKNVVKRDVHFSEEQCQTVTIFKIVSKDYCGKRKN